ncbi:uncharacterized protein [Procambarus clarkii]|uniref:uncharacterized protein n=1 Tax=Procambarus clarkii TaxID=6728 RepID=UPI001E6742BD|nr:uncharacterized protein LOC123762151 [Procambarus clarkii]
MGAVGSTSQLRRSVSTEMRSCGRILEDLEKHDFDCASVGGMKTVYMMFHSALDEIKTQCTIKDEEVVVCSQKSEVIEKMKVNKPGQEERTEANLDSVLDELDKLWDEEIALIDNAAAVFLLKLLCAVRLTLNKVLHKIS